MCAYDGSLVVTPHMLWQQFNNKELTENIARWTNAYHTLVATPRQKQGWRDVTAAEVHILFITGRGDACVWACVGVACEREMEQK